MDKDGAFRSWTITNMEFPPALFTQSVDQRLL